MSAATIRKSGSQGTAHPPIYGVPDCREWLAERERIRKLPWFRRMFRKDGR